MEKLMKPAEYAQELGISRQAVYAKIKKGILLSKNIEGKLYIVVDTSKDEVNTTSTKTPEKPLASSVKTLRQKPDTQDYKALLGSKDEVISILKGTVKDLKKSNKQITSTLRGEIDLLKEAFYEMRILYAKQLEYKKSHEPDEVIEVDLEEDVQWISLKKFFKREGIVKEKKKKKLQKRFKKTYKQGDNRLMFIDGKLKLNASKHYEDIMIKTRTNF